jgi:small conductance mechanosensitive channel
VNKTIFAKEAIMNWDWFSAEKLFDPGTNIGAMALAFLIIIIAWIACIFTTRLVRRAEWVMGRLRRQVDHTIINYIVRIKNVIIWLAGLVVYAALVPGLRALMNTMIAGAGITALVIGFAAKSTLANLISGLSLAVYRPFRIGDKVTIEAEYGTVEDITLRHTIVRTWENKMLIIPNEKMDNMSIVNYSIIDPSILVRLEVGVSYDTDIDLARRLMLEEANNCPQRLKEKEEPWVRVVAHGDFSIELRVYVWVAEVNEGWRARFWLLENVKKRFDKEGVEIPFPYRTLVYKKDMPPPRREELNT